MVSDQPGRLWLAAKTTTGEVVINRFVAGTGAWMGWCTTSSWTHEGGLRIPFDYPWCAPFCYSGFQTPTPYTWNVDSTPAISSWGPGRLDLFMLGTRYDGAIALLHAWRTGDVGEFRWEELGTGLMQGSPAAVSWGPGRIDVFARGGGSDLAHKVFANGRWYPWVSLGNEITASPAVVSTGPQQLSVYVRASDGTVHHRWYGATWFGWENLGGSLAPGVAPAPAARDEYNLEVYVLNPNAFVSRRSYNFGWSPFRRIYSSYTAAVTALYWRLN
jgi:hypothetical protein